MPQDKTHQPAKAAVMLFLATSVWGASFLAMKALGLKQQEALPGSGTWFLTSLSLLARFGVSALLVGLWLGKKSADVTRLEILQGAGLGAFGGLGILFQMDGVQHTAASTAAFLTQCYCVFIPVALAWHRRKIPAASLITGCVMVAAGVAVLANVDWRELRLGRGETESILGSILFTGQILWLERPKFHQNRHAVATFTMFVTVALVVLPVVLFTGNGWREWTVAYASWPTVILIGFLTLGGTLAAYATMNYWQPHVPATEAGLIYCCEPVFTSVFALFLPGIMSAAFKIRYPNESLTPHLLIGGGLVTAANLLAMWPTLRLSLLRPAADRAA